MTCPNCGAAYPPTARHCPTCGVNLHGISGAPRITPPTPLPVGATPGPGMARMTSAPLAAGTVLQGHYRIERVLGEGAFGRVYLATDIQDAANPPLAIKELLDRNLATPAEQHEAITWFKREVSTLLTLEHPGIPIIHGYWTAHTSTGPFYLIMDYIPGVTLQQALVGAGGRMAWRQVVEWGIALCDVLSYLHSRTPPVIFRDLKLPNVMLDSRTNQPVLIDFGIARQLAQAGGTTIGTPGYAPFEQWIGQAEPRSDLYALGALLHALLTGRNPETEYTRLRNTHGYDVASALRVLFPPVDTLAPGLPAALAQVLMAATAFEKEARFPDAGALAAALRQVLGASQASAAMAMPPHGQAPTVVSLPPPGPPAAAVSTTPAALTPTILAVAPPSPPVQPAVAVAGAASHLVGGSKQVPSAGGGIRARSLAFIAAGAMVVAAGTIGLLFAGHILWPVPQRAAPATLPTATTVPPASVAPPATATIAATATPPPPPTATMPATPVPTPTPLSRVLATHDSKGIEKRANHTIPSHRRHSSSGGHHSAARHTTHRTPARPAATATARFAPAPTASATPIPTQTVPPSPTALTLPTATARPTPTHIAVDVALEEARVRAAVIASNTAWMRALQTASAAGLARIKTDPNLQSMLAEVAVLQNNHEYWRIRLGHERVLWGRLLTRNHAQALLRKFDEVRVLYRQGRAAPLEVDRATYYDLYDLERVQGRWLVSRVSAIDDATGAHLAAAPPRGL